MFYSDECKREIRVSSPLSALRLLRIRVTSLVGRLSESSFHASERRATIKAILNLRQNDTLVAGIQIGDTQTIRRETGEVALESVFSLVAIHRTLQTI